MDALKIIAQDSMKTDAPKVNVGDVVKVHVRISEGGKSRIQIFEAYSYRKEARRYQRNLYSKTCSARLRNRKSIPASFALG